MTGNQVLGLFLSLSFLENAAQFRFASHVTFLETWGYLNILALLNSLIFLFGELLNVFLYH